MGPRASQMSPRTRLFRVMFSMFQGGWKCTASIGPDILQARDEYTPWRKPLPLPLPEGENLDSGAVSASGEMSSPGTHNLRGVTSPTATLPALERCDDTVRGSSQTVFPRCTPTGWV